MKLSKVGIKPRSRRGWMILQSDCIPADQKDLLQVALVSMPPRVQAYRAQAEEPQ
jgi:hypothetical protein